ncbi:MAG: signal peptidase II [Clostridia bacterium]|nr:signal peptidase II [Clostridia bacterium]
MNKNKLTSAKIKLYSVISIVLLVLADQIIKLFVDMYLKPVGSVPVIYKILQLSYYENDGAMMGMMSGKTVTMTVLAVICLGVIAFVIFSGKVKFGVDYCCIVLMMSGGLGNIIDRIFRGYVIDYIEVLFVDFYIFNFADCLVTCAAILMICNQIYEIAKERKAKKEKAADD